MKKIIFETYDGLRGNSDAVCAIATKGYWQPDTDLVRFTTTSAAEMLCRRGFDAQTSDSDISIKSTDGDEVILRWMKDPNGEEGYEIKDPLVALRGSL